LARTCSYFLRHPHHQRLSFAGSFRRLSSIKIPLHGNAQAANMSLPNEQHEWGAKKVRQTFLDYFKKNGHTFGMSWAH
jgi:hypothetical protein